MRNRKGFTLVELLVVVVIIGVISTMAWPTVNKLIENGNISKLKTYGDSMIAAAKIYTDSYEKDMFKYESDLTPQQKEDGQCYHILLKELIEHSYIKDYNYDDMTCLSDGSFVTVEKQHDKYTYTYRMGCGNRANIGADGKLDYSKISVVVPEKDPSETPNYYVADFTSCTHAGEMYTLTYDSNGGSECSPNVKRVPVGAQWGALCTPTKTGSSFDGWYNGSNLITDSTVPTSDVTAIAKWKTNKVKVIYKTTGGVMLPDHGANYTVVSEKVLLNGQEIYDQWNYGSNLGQYGLKDYNNKNHINIGKLGYHAVSGKEWKVLSIQEYYDGTWHDVSVPANKALSQSTNYAASSLCDASKGDCIITLAPNWSTEKNKISIYQKINGGYLASSHHAEVALDGEYLTYQGNKVLRTVTYGGKIHSDGLWDWNASGWINILKDGYRCDRGIEWKSLSGTALDQNTVYTYDQLKGLCDGGCNPDYNDCDLTFNANWQRNYSYVVFHVNEGAMLATHREDYNQVGDYISYSGNTYTQRVAYGESLGSSGLANYNNPNCINIGKENYYANPGNEFKTSSGAIFNQTTNYTSNQLCNSLRNNCTLDLYVNWIKVPVKLFYNVNGGTLKSRHGEPISVVDGMVYRYDNLAVSTIHEGGDLGADGLPDYNNSDYLNLNPPSSCLATIFYNPKSGEEWVTKTGSGDRTYSQRTVYTHSDFYGFCHGVYNEACRLTLYVKWKYYGSGSC